MVVRLSAMSGYLAAAPVYHAAYGAEFFALSPEAAGHRLHYLLYLFGQRIGGKIQVGLRQILPQKQVAHCPAYQEQLLASRFKKLGKVGRLF